MRLLLLLSIGLGLLGAPTAGRAQAAAEVGRYWVTLRDKQGVGFEPAEYFSPAARARRQRQSLPPADYTDRPVRPDYVAAVRAGVDTVTVVSRWFNALACRATPAQAAALRQLPGVAGVLPWPVQQRLRPASYSAAGKEMGIAPAIASVSAADYLLGRQQTAALGRADLSRAGLLGQGVRIAVFDVGFRGANRHPAFRALRRERRIAVTYDFLKNQPDVFRGGSHGTEVLGCLAGRLPSADTLVGGPALGLAPAATYLLARTEGLASERYSEEEAWLRAAEWADQQGADIISSSLAYTEQRYFPEEMDGVHSLIGRAATLAARKGLLVVSAAGNDGDDDWVRIGTPADADSVLAVGGLDPATGLHLAFSSVGPQLRPPPQARRVGLRYRAHQPTRTGGYERVEGTSFAAPLVAGLAACAQQASGGKLHGHAAVYQQRARGRRAVYPYYDYAHGYGRPEASRLLARLQGPLPAGGARPSTSWCTTRWWLWCCGPPPPFRWPSPLPLVAEMPTS